MGLLSTFLRILLFLISPLYVYPPKGGKSHHDSEPQNKDKDKGKENKSHAEDTQQPQTSPPTTLSVPTCVTEPVQTLITTTTFSSVTGTIPRDGKSSLFLPVTVSEPSPTESDPRVGWVYKLTRDRLTAELEGLGLPSGGTVQDLRKRLVTFLRTQARTPEPSVTVSDAFYLDYAGLPPYSSPPPNSLRTSYVTQGPLSSAREFTGSHHPRPKLEIIKEILGLPPTTDDDQVQAAISGLLEPPYSNQSRPRKVLIEDKLPSRTENRQASLPREHRTGNLIQNTSDLASTCNVIRKWNLKYDGGKDSVSFLERLDELMDAYGIDRQILLRAIPELLKGQALLWFRNNKDLWATYEDFLSDFKVQFLPPMYRMNLDKEIRNRTQGDTEDFRSFVIALSTLMRRKGGYTVSEQLDQIYLNMRPDYKLTIHRENFASVSEVLKLAEHYESYLREKQNYRAPPNPAQSLVPETAFYRFGNKSRTSSVEVNQFKGQDHDKGRYDNWNSRSKGEELRTASRFFGNQAVQDENCRNRSPTASSPRPRNNFDPRTINPRDRTQTPQPQTEMSCWNCGEKGHRFHDCKEPRVIKCFNCKKVGVRTIHCDCRKGNGAWVRREGGTPAPNLQTTPRFPPPANLKTNNN